MGLATGGYSCTNSVATLLHICLTGSQRCSACTVHTHPVVRGLCYRDTVPLSLPSFGIQEGQCAVSYTATLKHWCLWDTLWFCTHLARPTRPHLASVVAWVYPPVQGCQYATLPLGLLQHVAYAYLACCGVCLFVKRCSMLHGLYASGAMAMLLCLTSASMAIIVPPIMVDCMYALMLLCLASAGMAMVGPTYDGGCALRCCYALLVQAWR